MTSSRSAPGELRRPSSANAAYAGAQMTGEAAERAAPAVSDGVEVVVGPGGRVLIASDLHLGPRPTPSSMAAAATLSQTLSSWSGSGAVILNGDIVELLVGEGDDPAPALAAHQVLADALLSFSRRPGCRVLWLAGNHDARIVWDPAAAETMAAITGAELALAADVLVETAAGVHRVRVEHGHRLDPANAFVDPRSPAETPLGHHVATEVVPMLPGRGHGEILEGVESLADPSGFLAFVGSRLAYRTLGRRLGWFLLPLAAVVVLRVPGALRVLGDRGLGAWAHRGLLVAAGVLGELAVVGGSLVLLARRTWATVGTLAIRDRGGDQNDAPRAEAVRLAAAGYHGLVTGHSHHPELGPVSGGFYANCGCCCRVVDAVPARFGLPPPYLAHRQLSWVELEAGAELHVRLLHSQTQLPGSTWVERAAARRSGEDASGPTVVASIPGGPRWPPPAETGGDLRRTRRRAAVLVGVAGAADIASALTPPSRGRLDALLGLLPLEVPQAATALVVLIGIGLLGLAGGMRRGQRRAWRVATGLLVASAALHLLKGFDAEEAAVAVVVSLWFLRHRRAFGARSDGPSLRWGVVALVGGGALAVGVASAVILGSGAQPRPGLATAVSASGQRLVGIRAVGVDPETDEFLSPALAAAGAGVVAAAVWLSFRPVARRRARGTSTDIDRVRRAVAAHGSDTLSYFALRDDKQWYFAGDTVVAFGVFGGVCLVSPDPVGPPEHRDAAWAEFRRWADAQGWTVAVLGAGEDWLPTYRASGCGDLYLGDEAVVDCKRFSLDGGTRKGLRQAVNRIARNGYTARVLDPSALDPALAEALRELMGQSRRGPVERGFSMTLGRAFDPADTDLLLVVAFGPDGAPAAFCQFVPAPGIDGYSLDLMRRSEKAHPNGLTDFVVVETIRHLSERGMTGLALNFATMRAVLDGEAGESLGVRTERWVLRSLSESMQIESLWQYTEKFGPSWRPRYLAYDAVEHLPAIAAAVAKAESFWELPLLGRFLTPKAVRR